jgi:hypothetical protein
MRSRFALILIIVGMILIPNLQIVSAQSGNGCEIEHFTISPDERSYSRGVSIELFGSSTCGTVRFEVDGTAQAEISSTQQYETLQTSEISSGRHVVCFVARGTGNWTNANRECERILVRGSFSTADISYSTCPIDFTRIGIGDEPTVADYDPSPLSMRELPGLNQQLLSSIPVNTELTILNGPVCSGSWRWWQVEYDDEIGWVGEVGPERLFNLIPPQCAPHYLSFKVGDDIQVTAGTANLVRSYAGLEFPETDSVSHLMPLEITDGPVCNDGYWWWEIEYGDNDDGWTVEGDFQNNWLEFYP